MSARTSWVCDGCGQISEYAFLSALPSDWVIFEMKVQGEIRTAHLCGVCKLVIFNRKERHKGDWFTKVKQIWSKGKK